jgi:hypothetical protein
MLDEILLESEYDSEYSWWDIDKSIIDTVQ